MSTARVAEVRNLAGMWLRFSVVGLLKTVLDFATFNLILFAATVEGSAVVLVANTAGFCVAVASSFVLNRRFTFRVTARHRGFSRYVVVSLIGLALYNGSLAVVLLIAQPEGTLALNAAKVVSLVASMAWNFVGYRRFVFPPARAAGG